MARRLSLAYRASASQRLRLYWSALPIVPSATAAGYEDRQARSVPANLVKMGVLVTDTPLAVRLGFAIAWWSCRVIADSLFEHVTTIWRSRRREHLEVRICTVKLV